MIRLCSAARVTGFPVSNQPDISALDSRHISLSAMNVELIAPPELLERIATQFCATQMHDIAHLDLGRDVMDAFPHLGALVLVGVVVLLAIMTGANGPAGAADRFAVFGDDQIAATHDF